MCAGDHGPQEEARRGHSRRGLPPLAALHRLGWRRRTRQGLRLRGGTDRDSTSSSLVERERERARVCVCALSYNLLVEFLYSFCLYELVPSFHYSPTNTTRPEESDDYNGRTSHTIPHSQLHTYPSSDIHTQKLLSCTPLAGSSPTGHY